MKSSKSINDQKIIILKLLSSICVSLSWIFCFFHLDSMGCMTWLISQAWCWWGTIPEQNSTELVYSNFAAKSTSFWLLLWRRSLSTLSRRASLVALANMSTGRFRHLIIFPVVQERKSFVLHPVMFIEMVEVEDYHNRRSFWAWLAIHSRKSYVSCWQWRQSLSFALRHSVSRMLTSEHPDFANRLVAV